MIAREPEFQETGFRFRPGHRKECHLPQNHRTRGFGEVSVWATDMATELGHRYSHTMRARDLTASLSVAGLVLPEAVAYAAIAGLPPQRAILAAIVGALA